MMSDGDNYGYISFFLKMGVKSDAQKGRTLLCQILSECNSENYPQPEIQRMGRSF